MSRLPLWTVGFLLTCSVLGAPVLPVPELWYKYTEKPTLDQPNAIDTAGNYIQSTYAISSNTTYDDQKGNVAEFNGATSDGSIQFASFINPFLPSHNNPIMNWTLMTWIWLDRSENPDGTILFALSNTTKVSWEISIVGGSLKVRLHDDSVEFTFPGTLLITKQWFHLAITHTATSDNTADWRVFRDGQQLALVSSFFLEQEMISMNIGGAPLIRPNDAFDGYLDDTQIFLEVLSSVEIGLWMAEHENHGDGHIVPPEECDDGNMNDGDGCDHLGKPEPNFNCFGEPSLCVPICGDGVVAGTEGCDDGGLANGDGCSNLCQVEPGYACTGSPSDCNTVCGDFYWIPESEDCDLGVDTNMGCTNNCNVDVGWECESNWCTEIAGDGLIVGREQCDDNNTIVNDGCSFYELPTPGAEIDGYMKIELGWECVGEPSVCTPICGDGIIISEHNNPTAWVEDCDDGNYWSVDGCTYDFWYNGTHSKCELEPGWSCPTPGRPCHEIPADGWVVGREECDDGNLNDNDGCSNKQEEELGWACTGEPSECHYLSRPFCSTMKYIWKGFEYAQLASDDDF